MVDLWNAARVPRGSLVRRHCRDFPAARRGGCFGAPASTAIPIGGVVLAVGGLWSISSTWNVPAAVVLGMIGVGAAAAVARVCGCHVGSASRWPCRSPRRSDSAASWSPTRGCGCSSPWPPQGSDFAGVRSHLAREAPGLTLIGVSAFGVYATVPDTEVVAALVGVSLPLLVLGWPMRLATLGRAGAAATVVLLVWAGAVGGGGRPASIIAVVGASGCSWARPWGDCSFLASVTGSGGRVPRALALSLVASQIVLVLVAARAGGQLSDPLVAAAVGAAVGLAAVVLGALFTPPLPAGRGPCRLM